MTGSCDECGSQGRCRPECSHVRPVGGDASEACGCDGRHHPSCDQWTEPPDAVADFVGKLYGMSVVDEDRLTRRNPDWLDHHKFKGEK